MVAIGIDLGTTNSCVAVLQNGSIRVIEDDRGWRVIPSIVTYTEKDILVGWETFAHPESTVFEIKRLMGKTYTDANVEKHISRCNYEVVKNGNVPNLVVNHLGAERQVSPEDVSAEILKYLKKFAEIRLDQEISDAVITVPAYFSGSQRSATKRAAQLAGFGYVRIINEPTAAALSFQFDYENKSERKVLVFDFGGGTFDVTIATASKNSFVVIATDGDVSLGGTDIDANLVNFMMESIKNDIGKEVVGRYMLRLKKACKKAKEKLSVLTEIELDLMTVCGMDYFVALKRHKFDELNKDIFEKTINIVHSCLSAAKLNPNDIEEILLVGGSSRIPKIQEMLKNIFKRSKLNSTKNPDEDVARGAAIYAANLEGFSFKDVLSLSLGLGLRGGIMTTLIPRNTEIPCEETSTLITSCHNQTSMSLPVYQGESLISSKNQLLYNFTVNNIKKRPRGEVAVKFTFKVDSEGILSIIAEELNAENKVKLQIEIITSSVNEVNAFVENSKISKEDELKYVQFARRRMTFFHFCEDLKLENHNVHKLIVEIKKARAKAHKMQFDEIKEIDKLQSELQSFALSVLK